MKSKDEIIAKIKELVEEYEESYGEYDYDDEWPYDLADAIEQEERIPKPPLVQQYFSDKLITALLVEGRTAEDIFSDSSISFYGCSSENKLEEQLAGNSSFEYGDDVDIHCQKSGNINVFEVVSNVDALMYFGGSIGAHGRPMVVSTTFLDKDMEIKVHTINILMEI